MGTELERKGVRFWEWNWEVAVSETACSNMMWTCDPLLRLVVIGLSSLLGWVGSHDEVLIGIIGPSLGRFAEFLHLLC